MAGRGRPKKKVEVPETVQELIQRVEPELIETIPYVDPIVEDEPVSTPNIVWDVTLDTEIKHFDPTLSYELTGYRPVDEERGLDFNPEWFTEEHRRCNQGYESHGYRITGDNYFFLNYYRLKNTDVSQAGTGRETTFPSFFSKQYEYFHYIEMCEKLKKDVCALKARGVG